MVDLQELRNQSLITNTMVTSDNIEHGEEKCVY